MSRPKNVLDTVNTAICFENRCGNKHVKGQFDGICLRGHVL